MNTTLKLFAAGRIHEGEIIIVSENDVATVAPLEVPSAEYVISREQAEKRHGVKLVKYFTDSNPGAQVEDAYFMGITDRDLGLPTHLAAYSTPDERAAYLAGKCAAQDKYAGSGLSLEAIQAELRILQEAMEDENFWRWGGA
jgi:hypothetical protein